MIMVMTTVMTARPLPPPEPFRSPRRKPAPRDPGRRPEPTQLSQLQEVSQATQARNQP